MEELWLRNDDLIPEKEWIEAVDSLKSKEVLEDKNEVRNELKEKFIKAVEKRILDKKFGIFFSGGVDSSLIAAVCKKLGSDFVCYVVGFQDGGKEPDDVVEAKKVAKELGVELKVKVFNLKEAEEIIKKTVRILQKVGKTDVVNVGVGSVVLAAIELGKGDGIDYFFSGLGSEEIFAGYERHTKVEDINKECWEGLKAMWGRDLVRDFNLAKELEVTVKTPFLDKELIEYAMKIPGEWKLNDKGKKVVLRKVGEEFLGEFAWRKKKAAQYGSCFDKAIKKLAKREGFKLKKEWLEKI
jgi:asparagine synthase (glutamine-hydrolysing)